MFSLVRGNIFAAGPTPTEAHDRLGDLNTVGYKACGLALLPNAWTPPFVVLSTELYRQWLANGHFERQALLDIAVSDLEDVVSAWAEDWPYGLAFRSSATSETLRDRGAYQSIELTADYSAARMCAALTDIYERFAQLHPEGSIAIVVQARVRSNLRGHLSNERRISKTVNQWMWEQESPNVEGRFNSQRSFPPSENERLKIGADKPTAPTKMLQRIGRWCTLLNMGPVHLEWGVSGINIWLFQLDVEDDQPEIGCDPRAFLRISDATPAERPPEGSPFKIANFDEDTGWSKVDKVREFLRDREATYPQLCFASGAEIEGAYAKGRDLEADIRVITHDHAVCRTDCISSGIDRLNLPRTDTVSAGRAVRFIATTLEFLKKRGAKASEICFIVHKFIPARAAAWALADPDRQIVPMDALWGLPDGLQYLSHDSFEYDVRLNALSSETLRYKPFFLQETESGAWKLIPVQRRLARHRALSLPSIRQVAVTTHAIAKRLNRSIQIMWFCDVDRKFGIGENIPWFMTDAGEASFGIGEQIAPGLERVAIRSLEQLEDREFVNCVMELEPEAELFRNERFLDAVSEVALRGRLPVVIRGSTLGHAFYTLHRRGILVTATESARTRSRQRQVFRKLVRDEIPNRIIEKGERVNVARIAKGESRTALVVKLHEEAQELLQATKPSDVTAELADLLEIVRALCLATGIDFTEVQRAAEIKRLARGSFEKNVVLLDTSWPAWKEKARDHNNLTMRLSDLASVEQEGPVQIANFVSILSDTGATIELTGGLRVNLRLSGRGLEVKEAEEAESVAGQLSFTFYR